MKEIQLTEKQAWKIINVMHTDVECFMENLKANGYIKKTNLEITEEIYNRDKKDPVKAMQYIEELKEEIKRLEA